MPRTIRARELGGIIERKLKARPGFERIAEVVVVRAAPEVGWVVYAVDTDGASVARLECERIAARLRGRFAVRDDDPGGVVLHLPKVERSRRQHRSRSDIEALVMQDLRRRSIKPPVNAVAVIRGSIGWQAFGARSDDTFVPLPSAAPIIEAMSERYIID